MIDNYLMEAIQYVLDLDLPDDIFSHAVIGRLNPEKIEIPCFD
jgi:hypothetical protein